MKTSELDFAPIKTSDLDFADAPKDRYESLRRYNEIKKNEPVRPAFDMSKAVIQPKEGASTLNKAGAYAVNAAIESTPMLKTLKDMGMFEESQRDVELEKQFKTQSREERIKSDTGMRSFTSFNPVSEEFIGNETAFFVLAAIKTATEGLSAALRKVVTNRLEKESPDIIMAAMELAKDKPEIAKNLIRKETEKLLRKEDLNYPFKDKLANRLASSPPERRIGAGQLTAKEQDRRIGEILDRRQPQKSELPGYDFDPNKEYPSYGGTPLAVDADKEALNWEKFKNTIDKEDIVPQSIDNVVPPKPEKDISLIKFGEVKEKYYRNLESKMTTDEIKSIPIDVRKEEIINRMKQVNDGMQDAFKSPRLSGLKEKVIDDWQIVKELEKYTNIDVSPYLTRKMMHKKIGNKIVESGEFVREINKDITNLSKELNISSKELEDDVFEYLRSRHAPERNKEVGELAAGISDARAMENIAKIESKPHSTEIKRIAEKLQKYDRENLSIAEASGLISKEKADELRTKYPNHVPLQRVGFKDQTFASKGLNIKGSGIKKAVGSELEVKDLVKNIVGERIKLIQRAEKNIVDNETYKFVNEYINKYPDQELFEIVKPKAVGKTFGDEIIKQNINQNDVLQFQLDGKPAFIKIKDSRIASALRGVNRDQVPEVIKYIGAVTRFSARTATTYNPEFAFSNKFRDLQESIIYLASQKEVGLKSPKLLTKDVQSAKDIVDWMRGKDTEGAKLYQEMHDLGAAGSGKIFSNTKQIDKYVDAIRSEDKNKAITGIKNTLKTIDNWNTIFEDSTRLSAAKMAIENGLSKEQAARIFKDATLDFDTMGTWGPVVNSLWMFSNASAQGSAKMLRAMKNPKVAGVVTATVGAAAFSTNTWNDKIDPEWRSKVTKWDQLNSLNIVLPTDKFNYIAIPASIAIKPILIAMNKGYEIANSKGTDIKEATQDIVTSIIEGYNPIGGSDLTQTLVPTIARPFVDIARNKSYSGSKITPETYSKYTPESIKYFDTLEKSYLGRAEIVLTKKLGEHGIEISPTKMDYMLQQIVGGTGRFVSKSVNTLSNLIDKELPEFKEIPFASRFIRQTKPEQFRNTAEDKYATREISKIEKENFYKNKELKKVLDKNDLDAVYDYLLKQEPEDQIKTVDKLIESIKKQGVINEGWYKKLKLMPPEVRAVIFNNRYRKANSEEQSKMMEDAIRIGGILSSKFVMEFSEDREMK